MRPRAEEVAQGWFQPIAECAQGTAEKAAHVRAFRLRVG
jgi:hypothetical protein